MTAPRISPEALLACCLPQDWHTKPGLTCDNCALIQQAIDSATEPLVEALRGVLPLACSFDSCGTCGPELCHHCGEPEVQHEWLARARKALEPYESK